METTARRRSYTYRTISPRLGATFLPIYYFVTWPALLQDNATGFFSGMTDSYYSQFQFQHGNTIYAVAVASGFGYTINPAAANGFEFDQPEIILSNVVKFEVP